MEWTTPQKIIGIVAVGLAVGGVYYSIKWTKDWIEEKRKQNQDDQSHDLSKPFSKIIFFPDRHPTCKSLYSGEKCSNRFCRFSHEDTSFNKMMKYLMAAQKSVDLCVFVITSKELGQAVIDLHKRGVKIRVITDNEQVHASGSQINLFINSGIVVRHNNSSYLMHHKFVVVDGTLLINGSFNWTRHAVNCNNENVLITNERELVAPFVIQFDTLWETFKPATQCMRS